jgi:hypothetical protein
MRTTWPRRKAANMRAALRCFWGLSDAVERSDLDSGDAPRGVAARNHGGELQSRLTVVGAVSVTTPCSETDASIVAVASMLSAPPMLSIVVAPAPSVHATAVRAGVVRADPAVDDVLARLQEQGLDRGGGGRARERLRGRRHGREGVGPVRTPAREVARTAGIALVALGAGGSRGPRRPVIAGKPCGPCAPGLIVPGLKSAACSAPFLTLGLVTAFFLSWAVPTLLAAS